MERVLTPENLRKAWHQVKANHGAPGVAGRTIEDFPAFARESWPSIRQAVRDGTYQPQPVTRVEISKSDGGVRKLGIPTVRVNYLQFNELSDFVEITHPFHPFRGQRHPIITSKKWEHRDLLSLVVIGRGTLCVPREWTDRADPAAYSSYGPLLLSYERLVELAEFLPHLRKKTEE